jgi:hypothetical protein
MQIRTATNFDSPQLARFLLDNPMAVGTDFALDRTPDFNALLRLRGNFRTLCAYSGDHLAGTVTALWDERSDHGKSVRVGEIIDLRVAAPFRGGRTTSLLLRAAQRALEEAGVQWVFCLIGDQNQAARVLVRGRAGIPALQPLTRYVSVHYLALRVNFLSPRRGLRLRAAEDTSLADADADAEAIAHGFAQIAEGRRLATQSRPFWPDPTGRHRAWLVHAPGGGVVGGLVIWDGFDVRRFRVMRYSGLDRLMKLLTVPAARLGLAVALPEPGGALRLWASRAFWAESGRPDIVRAMVAAALDAAVKQGVHIVQLNLPQGDPLIDQLPSYPRSSYWSTLYGIRRDGGPVDSASGPFHAELALV